MAFFRDSPELKLLQSRLIANQTSIGDALGKQYGLEVGKKITKLLEEHIGIAVDILGDIKTKNESKKNIDVIRFYSNADIIGKYFDDLKGVHIFRHHMKMHIDTLLNSVISFVNNDTANDIKFTDAYITAGIKMAFDLCHY